MLDLKNNCHSNVCENALHELSLSIKSSLDHQ